MLSLCKRFHTLADYSMRCCVRAAVNRESCCGVFRGAEREIDASKLLCSQFSKEDERLDLSRRESMVMSIFGALPPQCSDEVMCGAVVYLYGRER